MILVMEPTEDWSRTEETKEVQAGKQEHEVELTPRFCVVALPGFEPESWLRSRLGNCWRMVTSSEGVEKRVRLKHEGVFQMLQTKTPKGQAEYPRLP